MPRTPLYLQAQGTECCIAVLGAVLAHFGRWVDLAELRRVTGISRDCLHAGDIARAARHYGLAARVLRKEPEELAELGFPLIVHLDFVHFAVVDGISATHVQINDPSHGPVEISREEFDESFTGIVIALTPTPDFRPGGTPPDVLDGIRARLPHPARRQIGLAALASLCLPLTLALFATGLGAWMDCAAAGLASGDWSMLLAWVVAGRAGMMWLSLRGLAAAERNIAESGTTRLLDRFARQPQSFFSYRMPGALGHLALLNPAWAAMLCRRILPAAGRGANALVLLAMLGWMHPAAGTGVILLMAIAGLAVWWLVSRHGWRLRPIFLQPLPATDAVASRPEGSKTGGMAGEWQAMQAGRLAGAIRERQIMAPVFLALRAIPHATALAVAILLVVLVGVAQPGQLLALLILAWPIPRVLPALARLPGDILTLRMQLFLLDDAETLVEPAKSMSADSAPTLPPDTALVARNLTFGYARSRPPLLQDVSLTLAPGEVLGITGSSGGGKSTLAAVLSGVFTPWAGSVSLGGVSLAALSASARPAVAAWIGKETFFFAGSLRDNLRLWRDGVSDAELDAALADACLTDVVAARPDGLDSPVSARGGNFSGGQRQRLEIARALVHRPRLLLLDEATDGLDPAIETQLLANLRRRGCMVVLVSHRLSSLSACDRVLRVEDGRIVVAGEGHAGRPADAEPAVPAVQLGLHEDLPCVDEACSPVPDPARLAACFTQVMRAGGLTGRDTGVPVLDAGNRDRSVRSLAQARGKAVRRVRFTVGSWWKEDPGPLLAFARATGEPVLVRRRRGLSSGYVVSDADGSVLPRQGALQDWLDPDCYAFTALPVGAGGPDSVAGLLGRTIVRERGPLAGAVGASLLGGCLAFAPVWLIVEAGPGGPWLAGLLAVAALSWDWQAGLLLARVVGRQQAGVDAELHHRVLDMTVPARARLGASRLAAGLQGGQRVLQALHDVAAPEKSLPGALGGVVGGVLALALLRPAWGLAGGGLALGALLPAVWLASSDRLRQQWAEAGWRSARFLFDVLDSLTRLRAAGRMEAAFAHWRALERQVVGLAASLRQRRDAIRVWRDGYPRMAQLAFAAAGLSSARDFDPVAWLAGVVALGWMLRYASVAGDALVGWIEAAPQRRALSDLLAAPQENGIPAVSSSAGDAVSEPALGVRVSNLRYRYPGSRLPVLDDVSLTLTPGRITALTGPSGSGKSTLLRLLLGFEAPQEGQVRWDGVPPESFDTGALRAGIGLVMQDASLEGVGTLRWHVSGLSARTLPEVWQALRQAVLADEVARMPMGIQTIVENARLSSGQWQRLLIARCLLRRPRLLILDEATSALSDAVQARLLAQVRALGITCLLVTHRASALACADAVVVLDKGRVIWTGAPGDEGARPYLAKLAARERRDDVDEREEEVMPTPVAQGNAGTVPATEAVPGRIAAPRRGLFRAKALAHFQGEQKITSPLLLTRQRFWPAALACGCTALAWLAGA